MILVLFSFSVSLCWSLSIFTSPLLLIHSLSLTHLFQLFLVLPSSHLFSISISSPLFLLCSVGLFPSVTYVLTIVFLLLKIYPVLSSPVLSCPVWYGRYLLRYLICALPSCLPWRVAECPTPHQFPWSRYALVIRTCRLSDSQSLPELFYL